MDNVLLSSHGLSGVGVDLFNEIEKTNFFEAQFLIVHHNCSTYFSDCQQPFLAILDTTLNPQCAVNSTLSSPHTQTQSSGASGLVYKGYIRRGKVQSVRVCQHGHISFTLSILLNFTSYYMFLYDL